MAKRTSRKMTANQRAYAKELKRIKQAVKRLEKRGYRFVENAVPETPKRITHKALQRIKELKGNKIYDLAQYLDENTGKVVSGLEGKKIEQKERARKSAETRKKKKKKEEQYYPDGGSIIADNIVDSFISKLSEPEPPMFPYNQRMSWQIEATLREMRTAKTTLLGLVNSIIAEIGKSALGWRLQERADDVDNCINTIVYIGSSSEAVASACRELAEIIKGSPLTMAEMQDLGEQSEYNESYELPE